MTVNYLKNQELHATDSVMDDRFKKKSPIESIPSALCFQRFQKLYNGYQQSDSAEKKQLVALHLQHRQGELNGMKRKELEAYMAELQKSPVRVSCHKESSLCQTS